MKKILFLALATIISLSLSAQTTQKKAAPAAAKTVAQVVIQTNGVCQKCADCFKTKVPTFKGVKSCSYDMKTSKLTVNYDSKLTTPDQLRQQISKLGYNADNVKADPAARAKLPACCKDKKSCTTTGSSKTCSNSTTPAKTCSKSTTPAKTCGTKTTAAPAKKSTTTAKTTPKK